MKMLPTSVGAAEAPKLGGDGGSCTHRRRDGDVKFSKSSLPENKRSATDKPQMSPGVGKL